MLQVAGGRPHGAERRRDEFLRVGHAGGRGGEGPHPADRVELGHGPVLVHGDHAFLKLRRARNSRERTVAAGRSSRAPAACSSSPSRSRRTRTARCSGVSRASTSRTSAASCGSPGAGTSASSAGTARAACAGDPDRLPHRDRARPAVDGGGLAQPAEILQDRDERLLGGVRAVLQRDRAADPAHIRGQRVHQVRHGDPVAALGRADQRRVDVGWACHQCHCDATAVSSAGTVRGPPRPRPRAARRAGSARLRERPAACMSSA